MIENTKIIEDERIHINEYSYYNNEASEASSLLLAGNFSVRICNMHRQNN